MKNLPIRIHHLRMHTSKACETDRGASCITKPLEHRGESICSIKVADTSFYNILEMHINFSYVIKSASFFKNADDFLSHHCLILELLNRYGQNANHDGVAKNSPKVEIANRELFLEL